MKTVDQTPVAVRWPRAVSTMSRRRSFAMWVLIVAAAVPMVDPFVTTTLMVKVGPALGMSVADKALAASLAGLVMACAILPLGVLGDRIGRKKIFMMSMVVVVVGQVVCALSPTMGVFLGGRAITGLGLAGSYAMSMALVGSMFEPKELSRVFGKMFATVALVAVVALTVATAAIGTNWRMGYLFLPALSVVVICLAVASVPESIGNHRKFDVIGSLLAAVGLFAIIVGLGQAASVGWGSPVVVLPVILGIGALVVLVRYESRIENPSLPMALIRIPRVSASLLVIVLVNIGVASIALLIPMITEGSFGWTPEKVLIVSIGMMVGEVVGALIGGRKPSGRKADLTYLVGSVLIVAAGFVIAAFATATSPFALLASAMFLVGIGLMIGITTGATLVIGNSPKDQLGAAGAIKPVATQVGTAIGLGVMAPIMAVFAGGATGTAVGVATHAFSMTMLLGAAVLLVGAGATAYLMRSRPAAASSHNDECVESGVFIPTNSAFDALDI